MQVPRSYPAVALLQALVDLSAYISVRRCRGLQIPSITHKALPDEQRPTPAPFGCSAQKGSDDESSI